ncbi:hypothetical protein UFOVP654_24 [uncultured Caudovirales phage]|uniref:Uncharacterized protein n=1 Tax=uncultured Caudovirales phage TaxID=2100421 RepID=A0A6J5NB71_9CAUD|nr:hypothetical protein UFOVP654_24 [uncultured Caudovirales phage]
MSIVQTQTTSFKKELYQGIHDLSTDTIKIALYTGNADLNEATTAYTTSNQVSASGYTAGGQVMTGVAISSSGYVAYVNWANVSWTAALTARCALIYNASKGNKSVAVLDFGSDKTSTTTFTITMPANTSTTALIRSSN